MHSSTSARKGSGRVLYMSFENKVLYDRQQSNHKQTQKPPLKTPTEKYLIKFVNFIKLTSRLT